jgi:hypothetical protein
VRDVPGWNLAPFVGMEGDTLGAQEYIYVRVFRRIRGDDKGDKDEKGVRTVLRQ